jgi:phosphoserine aminotransferase
MNRKYNLSAGPAVLPLSVLEQAKQDLISYTDLNGKSSGIGILEMSHRSSLFDEIITSAQNSFKTLLKLPSNYKILFCTGGATQQFSMVPLNLAIKDKPANYIITGEWAKKALEEASRFVTTHVAASSESSKFKELTSEYNFSKESSYVHFTSNNTLYGTQFKVEPECKGHVLICDASSDLMHKPIDINKYGLIYAGAQKNLGAVGVTIVIIREDLLDRVPSNLALNLDYKIFAKNHSLYNTAPTFSIYLVAKVLKWIEDTGGLEQRHQHNLDKAKLLYDYIDQSQIYYGYADKKDRSLMNLTFRIRNESLEKDFLRLAEEQGFSGLTGHRSVGGMRASLYNAFPIEGVVALIDFMKNFENKHA